MSMNCCVYHRTYGVSEHYVQLVVLLLIEGVATFPEPEDLNPRDCWVEKHGDAVRIHLYISPKRGSGAVEHLRRHPWYDEDKTDEVYPACMSFYFMPKLRPQNEVDMALIDQLMAWAQEPVDTAARWLSLLWEA